MGLGIRDKVTLKPRCFLQESVTDYSLPLTGDTFDPTLKKYPVVVVNFMAPW